MALGSDSRSDPWCCLNDSIETNGRRLSPSPEPGAPKSHTPWGLNPALNQPTNPRAPETRARRSVWPNSSSSMSARVRSLVLARYQHMSCTGYCIIKPSYNKPHNLYHVYNTIIYIYIFILINWFCRIGGVSSLFINRSLGVGQALCQGRSRPL